MKALLWIFVALATGTYICGPIVDPDLWWHITAGRWILAHTQIPEVDYWNNFGVGQPWRAYSWSNEILFALVDRFGQYSALADFKLLLGALLALSFFYCYSKISEDWFFGALLGIFTTCACFDHFTLRPQTIVWIYLVWLLFLLDQIERHGLSARRLLGIMLIHTLWANTHITTIFGLAVSVCWLLRRKADLALVFKVSAAAFLATLITPYLGGEWLTFLSKTDHPFAHRAIAEFHPATIMQFSTGFLVLDLLLLLVFLHYMPQALAPLKLFLGVGFVIAGLAVVKFLPVSVIILSALIAYVWRSSQQQKSSLGNLAEAIERLKSQFQRVPIEGLSFLVLVLVVLNVHRMRQGPLAHEIVPVAALDFIIQQKLPYPLLNDFGHGGYVMYRLSDQAGNLEQKVSIDGRTNVGPAELFENFQAAYLGKTNWKSYLDMVQPRTILWRVASPLTSILLETGQWCQVFGDLNDEKSIAVFVDRQTFLESFSGLSSSNCSQEK